MAIAIAADISLHIKIERPELWQRYVKGVTVADTTMDEYRIIFSEGIS